MCAQCSSGRQRRRLEERVAEAIDFAKCGLAKSKPGESRLGIEPSMWSDARNNDIFVISTKFQFIRIDAVRAGVLSGFVSSVWGRVCSLASTAAGADGPLEYPSATHTRYAHQLRCVAALRSKSETTEV